MFFYEIGYSDWEASPISVLWHPKQFTQKEFDEMVLDCYVKISKAKEAEQLKWEVPEQEIDTEGLTEEEIETDKEYTKDLYKYYPRVSDLNSDVIELLINEYGFASPVISASFVADDTADIVPRETSLRPFKEDIYCEKLKLLRERFNVIEPRDNKINGIIDGL